MYNLLVIDDDFMICKVLANIFASEKYGVRTSRTVGEGFKACLAQPPDLILLDINLPDGSGLDLCRRIKETPGIKHIPVIILTGGAAETETREAGLDSGAEDYFPKPFVMEEIVARVAEIIKLGRMPTGVRPV